MKTIFTTLYTGLIVVGILLAFVALTHDWLDWVSYMSAASGALANTLGWMLKGMIQ